MNDRQAGVGEVEQRLTAAFQAKAQLLADRQVGAEHQSSRCAQTTHATGTGPRRRLRAWLLPAVAAAVVALVAAGYWIVAHDTGRDAADQHPTSSASLDPVTEGRLWDLAAQVARQDGATIRQVQAVKTTAVAALRLLFNAADSGAANQPVWAVQVEATAPFHCQTCPAGRPTLPERYIVLVVDASSFESRGGGVRNRQAGLARLGAVLTVHDTGVIPSGLPQPFGVHVQLTNLGHHTARVFGCPHCTPNGLPLAPGKSMSWTERRHSPVSYLFQVAGHKSSCPTPMKPAHGAAQAENYTITPDGRCHG